MPEFEDPANQSATQTQAIDYERLADGVARRLVHTHIPRDDRQFSPNEIDQTLNVLRQRGYDDNTLEAAKIQMAGIDVRMGSIIDQKLGEAAKGFSQRLRNEKALSIVNRNLSEHYRSEDGSRLKKMDAAIRTEINTRYMDKSSLRDRWDRHHEVAEQELDDICDEVVDSFYKDVLGKDKSSRGPVLAKSASPAAKESSEEDKGTESGGASSSRAVTDEIEGELSKLTEDQRGFFDARFNRLVQKQRMTRREAAKQALAVAKTIPSSMPRRGREASLIRY